MTDGVEIGSGATIEIDSGGTLILPSLVERTGTATLFLNGGILEATGAFTSTIPIAIGAGGGTVNTNGYDVTLAGNLSAAVSAGPLIKNGRRHADLLRRQQLHGRHLGPGRRPCDGLPQCGVEQRNPDRRPLDPRGPGCHDHSKPRRRQYKHQHCGHANECGNQYDCRYGDGHVDRYADRHGN